MGADDIVHVIGKVERFRVVMHNGESVLIASDSEILHESSTWAGLPPDSVIYAPAQAARCRRVYFRLEPHGA